MAGNLSFKRYTTSAALLLSFPIHLIRPGLAQYQPLQGIGVLMDQNNPGQVRLISAEETPKSYRRIRITTREEIETTYPLIAAYVKRPELAFSVDEFAIDTYLWPSQRNCYLSENDVNKELHESPQPVQDDSHSAIEEYVRALELGNEITDTIINSLEWKRQHLKGQIPVVSKGFNTHNMEYAFAATVILLSLCRNITIFHVAEIQGGNPLQDYLLKSNYGLVPQPGLQRLRTVNMGYVSGEYATLRDERYYHRVEFLDYFRYFHRLPSLEAINMDGVMEFQANRELFPPRTSASLRTLRFTHADISSTLLGTMLRIPQRLEAFTLSLGGLWHRDGGSPHLLPKTLGKCLLEHRTSLRQLDLDVPVMPYQGGGEEEDMCDEEELGDYDDDDEEYYSHERDAYYLLDEELNAGSAPLRSEDLPATRVYGVTVGSLHDFAALTHLSISVGLLLGPRANTGQFPTTLGTPPPFRLVDALPPGLEYLRLYDYTKGENTDVDEHVEELLRVKAERFSRLMEVKGVDEAVLGVNALFPAEGEEDLWQRPEIDLDWVAA